MSNKPPSKTHPNNTSSNRGIAQDGKLPEPTKKAPPMPNVMPPKEKG